MRPNLNTSLAGANLHPTAEPVIGGFRVPEAMGVRIGIADSGKKFSVTREEGKTSVLVNRKRFSSDDAATVAAVTEASALAETEALLGSDPKSFLRVTDKRSLLSALRIAGTAKIKSESPDLAAAIARGPFSGNSVREEFDHACRQYVLTGKPPTSVSDAVGSALSGMKSKGGKNALDFLASGGYSADRMATLYREHVALARDAAVAAAKGKTRSTEGNSYRPNVGLERSKTMNEDQIKSKVEPFFGGYYRGNVFRYDPETLQIVEDPTDKFAFVADIPDEGLENEKIRTFSGIWRPGKEKVLELPYGAIPLPESLRIVQNGSQDTIAKTLSRVFKKGNSVVRGIIMRDLRGVFSLAMSENAVGEIPFSFDFVVKPMPSVALNDEPSPEDSEPAGFALDAETEEFLTTLNSPHVFPREKAERLVAFVRKKFEYPADDAEMNAMNEKYLAAGQNAFSEMCAHGKADCHWSNLFFGECAKRAGLSHRVLTGFYVQKDPRFEFAGLAGTGHAWSEVWTQNEWVRFDATPAKEKDDDEEEQEDQEGAEGDYGEQSEPEDQEALIPEEIEELYGELLAEAEKDEEKEVSDKEIFPGVPFSKWKEVERFVKAVNDIPVPRESSIRKRPSTLYEEWRALFKLIYRRREIPETRFRGPVRRSESPTGLLDDPVTAYVDLRSGDDDPSGFKVETVKSAESIDVTEFEDDFVLDLTKSMKQSGAYLDQKKMVLSGCFNLMGLNRRLNLSYNKSRMRSPITVKTHVASFWGETSHSVHHTRDEEMDKKKLVALYDALDQTQRGAGNLLAALRTYKATVTGDMKKAIRAGKLRKVCTVVSDGEIADQGSVAREVAELRAMGVIVQGIGFWPQGQSIRLVCHDPWDPDAAVVLDDVRQASLARHKLLAKHLKNL